VGSYLAGQLSGLGHRVTLTEVDSRRARDLAENIEVLVIEGDGTSIDVLRAADVERTDWLVAVTGQDETNLVACEIGSTLGAAHTLARLNDPRNRPTFSALGIQVVAVTDLIGEVIEHEVVTSQLERLTLLGGGSISLIEVEIPAGVADRAVRDLRLPKGTVLVTRISDGEVSIPRADTILASGDRVVAVTTLDLESDVRDVLRGDHR
jgi:trk system potassium uptake protein TrkA